jgi:hypothetical protein
MAAPSHHAASGKLRTSASGLLLHDLVAPYRSGWEAFEIWRALYRLSMVLLAAVPTGVSPKLGLVQSLIGACGAGTYAAVLWRRVPFERARFVILGRTFHDVTNKVECASASLGCACSVSSIILYAAPAAGSVLSVLLLAGTVLVAVPMMLITVQDMRCCCCRRRRSGVDSVRSLFHAGDVAGAARLAMKRAEERRLRKRAVDADLEAFTAVLNGTSTTSLRAEGAGGRTDDELMADMAALRAEQVALALAFAPPQPQQAIDAAIAGIRPALNFEAARAQFVAVASGVIAAGTSDGVPAALSALLAAGAETERALVPVRETFLGGDWVDAAAAVQAAITANKCADAAGPRTRSATAAIEARVAESCAKLRAAVAEKRWAEAAERSTVACTVMAELRWALAPAVTRAVGARKFHAAVATAVAVAATAASVDGIVDAAPEAPRVHLDEAFVTRTRELGAAYRAAMVAIDEPGRVRAKEQLTGMCDAHAARLDAALAAHIAERRYRAAAHAIEALRQVAVLRKNRGEIALGGQGACDVGPPQSDLVMCITCSRARLSCRTQSSWW